MAFSGTTDRYVIFLKGINVGGHTVKMARLRELFTEMGFGNVATHIASGNVVLTAPDSDSRALERTIEAALDASLGYPVPAFARTDEELLRIASFDAFSERQRSGTVHGTYVAFLRTPAEPDTIRRVTEASTDDDLFRLYGRELYWLCRTRFSDSPFSGPALEKLLGGPTTVRKTTTVAKISSRYFDDEQRPWP